MSAAHTPGPWVVEDLPADPYIVYAGGIHGNGERRQVCVTANGFFGCDESIANARLISAAPELLEALRLCLHAVCLAGWEGDLSAEKARAAIAKATGEQQ